MEREEKPQRHKGYKERKETKIYFSPAPSGANENSPAIHRWVPIKKTTKSRRDEWCSAVPTGLRPFLYLYPALEVLGYYHSPLTGLGRNKSLSPFSLCILISLCILCVFVVFPLFPSAQVERFFWISLCPLCLCGFSSLSIRTGRDFLSILCLFVVFSPW